MKIFGALPPCQLRAEFDQQRGLQRAVHDQAGITFYLGNVVAIVMDAMAIEGQCGVAEQQHRIRYVGFAVRRCWRRRGLCGSRVLAARRDIPKDDVMALADGRAALR